MGVRSDIVVVGSGIVGCAAAFELGRRGASVLVVDDRLPGMGATQASAGMLAPYNEVEEEGVHLELTVRGLDLFDGFMAQLASEGMGAVPYRRTGTLTVASDEAGCRRLDQLARLIARRGVEAERLGPRDVRAEESSLSPRAAGGLLIPTHGYVAASAFTKTLVAAAQAHGVRFCRGPHPNEIRRDGSGVLLTGGANDISAGYAIVAAGSWSSQIRIEGASSPVPVQPVRGQLLHLRADGMNLRRVTWGEHAYLVPWDDGSLLVGATVEHVGYDERTTVDGLRDLMTGVAEMLAPGWPATVLAARAGLRPATPDGLPIVGRSAAVPGVTYATGHYRNGVLLAPLTARFVADALLDGRVDPLMQALSPARFGEL